MKFKRETPEDMKSVLMIKHSAQVISNSLRQGKQREQRKESVEYEFVIEKNSQNFTKRELLELIHKSIFFILGGKKS